MGRRTWRAVPVELVTLVASSGYLDIEIVWLTRVLSFVANLHFFISSIELYTYIYDHPNKVFEMKPMSNHQSVFNTYIIHTTTTLTHANSNGQVPGSAAAPQTLPCKRVGSPGIFPRPVDN